MVPIANWSQRLDVSDWRCERPEPRGTSKPQWLVEPDSGVFWLYKGIRCHKNGSLQGSDWAEVIATQVGKLLQVPCAETRLCWREGERGSISRNVTPAGSDLVAGGDILESLSAPGYERQGGDSALPIPEHPTLNRPGHNLDNIRDALKMTLPPPDRQHFQQGWDGFDVFAGYLVLDALIANRDRHEDNWAVLRTRLATGKDRLAPSYDHGGSLGYNLLDTKREGCLRDPTRMEQFARRGTAHRFEHRKGSTPPSLVKLVAFALDMCHEQATSWWRSCLCALDLTPIHEALHTGISEMSATESRFVLELLNLNRRRLCDELDCS